ncbi:hypothetical protein SAY87_022485 [Trapa incisa]|uniref:Uncharacterized protein n=1 Tax=Trapa incisa TaxID=236973 RepID=A0AAN7K489_9MYRT|nr:hypothetical protein SAY87_022484 [Trapa incisa]KAK4759354.1 hypothetical protein SAY87_022485 [Trapa incisa]
MSSIFKSSAFLLIITLALIYLFPQGAAASSRLLSEQPTWVVEKYAQWMATYDRVYLNDAERESRLGIFKSNLEFIESFNNAGNKTFKLAINQFADMTNEEFRAYWNNNVYKKAMSSHTLSGVHQNSSFKYENAAAVPSSIDWRERGAVTPVKNQGQCGCCWAFSAVSAIEGIIKITTGRLVSLSVQELVDCDTEGVNKGCSGGLMDVAFEFIVKNGGIMTEADYPYKGVDGTCAAKNASRQATMITGFEDVPAYSELSLQKAVAIQPVSVAIDAGGYDMQFYSSGVYTGECGTQLNHGVAAVGYGADEDSGAEYWIVKNSWGEKWGEGGYVKIARNVDAKEGHCGIAMQASYPIAHIH